ncbi:TraB/GumN family protein [Kordia sp. YSTF-M3]|uniref:TraB/GumN family protein n=1 Tax=Kordia aestuariivivens TaxID=2759037 RepID=A0ABR7Q7J1_9FLAO|nr:TraB/GumN family protein [Kordia aestuariivivens]MBC8754546.1 TraB/GumN family protein [Kordia aestuariivivens]
MNKKLSLLILCVLTVFISCNSSKSIVNTSKGPKLEKSLLWKITGKDIKKPSYLYGTIHLTCDYEFTDKLKKAFDETDRLVLEIDMSNPNLQMDMMKFIFMEDGKTIKGLLNEDDYKTLADFFKEQVGMDLKLFDKMKPLAITSTITAKMAVCDNGTAYDMEFMKVSKAQNEEVIGLETIADQMKVFDDIPYEDQLKTLVEMAKEGMEESKKGFEEMTRYYNAEDLEGLLKVTTEQGLEGDFQESLVDQRNRNWIPLIEKITAEAPTFIGVGALHLPGEQGVINLLRKQGYTVVPVY